jgi:hypothetical protein
LVSKDGVNGVGTSSFKLRANYRNEKESNTYKYLCIFPVLPAALITHANFAISSFLVRRTRNEQVRFRHHD